VYIHIHVYVYIVYKLLYIFNIYIYYVQEVRKKETLVAGVFEDKEEAGGEVGGEGGGGMSRPASPIKLANAQWFDVNGPQVFFGEKNPKKFKNKH
jgi:hypothetical protein